MQLSQLKEPIHFGPSGTMVKTMNSTDSLRVVKDLWERKKWLFIMTVFKYTAKFPTLEPQGSNTLIKSNSNCNTQKSCHFSFVIVDSRGLICNKGMRGSCKSAHLKRVQLFLDYVPFYRWYGRNLFSIQKICKSIKREASNKTKS